MFFRLSCFNASTQAQHALMRGGLRCFSLCVVTDLSSWFGTHFSLDFSSHRRFSTGDLNTVKTANRTKFSKKRRTSWSAPGVRGRLKQPGAKQVQEYERFRIYTLLDGYAEGQ